MERSVSMKNNSDMKIFKHENTLANKYSYPIMNVNRKKNVNSFGVS